MLTASLDEWSKGVGTCCPPDEADRRWRSELRGRLLGFVEITNGGAEVCEFPATAAAELWGDDGAVLPVEFTRPSSAPPLRTIDAGVTRHLRVHWTGPYCGPVSQQQSLVLSLEGSSRPLVAVVATPSTPPCLGGENDPVEPGTAQVHGLEPRPGDEVSATW
ncbi:MAG: hypothetical protein ACRDZ7_06205 [Acidimicrobiia bacterium]